MSADLLATVVAAARTSARERARAARSIEAAAEIRRPDGVGFAAAFSSPGTHVIAECKRRSPSRGILRQRFDPVAIARGYERAGAAAVSVLTEPTFFDGSLDHLAAVRHAVRVPLLRKDFIVDPFQIVEARACGADAVLLIVAALDDGALADLIRRAASLGLAALVEVHDADELERARQSGATLVGVNSRNLRTLAVSPAVFDELASRLEGLTGIAESGLRSAADLVRLMALGYRGFLIGERFMTAEEPAHALAGLLAEVADRRSAP